MSYQRNEDFRRFCCSGVASLSAGFLTTPIHVIKVRLQLDNQLSGTKNIFENRYYKGFIRGGVVILKEEGIRGLFKGVGASVLRDGVYSTFRIGAYEPVKELLGAKGSNSVLWKKMIAGAIVGSIGSAICNPTDLVMIRMQGEGKLPPGVPPRYRNLFHAFSDIIKKEGVRKLWKGVIPTVQRAAILSATQIPAYDHTKHTLLRNEIFEEGLPLHMVSSMIAGLATAMTTNPVDVVKTRIMNEKVLAKETLIYVSTASTFVKVFKHEGIGGFYKGFIPNWARLGPHTIITFLIFEQLRKLLGLRPV